MTLGLIFTVVAALAYDANEGTLTETARAGEKPWVFPCSSDGVLGRYIQKGDSRVLDFRAAVMPDGVPKLKALGDGCLSGTDVEEVYLPNDTLVSIGPDAFADCGKLRRIEPMIPDSVLHLGPYRTFVGCGVLEGRLVIGGAGQEMNSLQGDNRFMFTGLGRIGEIVFGEGVDQSYFTWSFGGFAGCESVTSIVCRVQGPLDWSQGVSYPEGCRTCLFQDMKRLQSVDVAGWLSSAAGLPEIDPGACTLFVPSDSAEWRSFLSRTNNVSAGGLTQKGNEIKIPAGYRVVVKHPSPVKRRWGYELKFPELKIDPDAKPIRDVSTSSAFPILGFAGALVEEDAYSKYFFVDDRDRTARVFRQAGVRLVRLQGAVTQWQMGAGCGRMYRQGSGYNYEEYRVDMKDVFRFYKDMGIRILLTLENDVVYTDPYNGVGTNDLAIVKKVICDNVRWIVENDFKDVVAGFELGNEPYWQGSDLDKNPPEAYAARWIPIVTAIKEIWPEASIGIALAEYMKDDPDVKAVRARMLAEERVVDGGYFDESTFNQWSGRYVVAMKPVLDKIDHVIYHSYGGAVAESCSPCGIFRYRVFTKAFPELDGKKFWITEWRERSDEDNRSHQRFHETLFKAGYVTMMLAQPDVDALNLHQLYSLSGALYLSGVAPESAPSWLSRTGMWCVSWDSSNVTRPHPSSIGKPELHVGISGPVFRLYTEALLLHPIVLDFGSTKRGFQSQGMTNAIWAASLNYSNRKDCDCQVLVTMNREKSSIALLAVNTRPNPARLVLKPTANYRLCGPDYRVYSCPEEFLYRHEIPGEGKFTRLYGYEDYPAPMDPYAVEIPANSVTTVTIPVAFK